MVKKIIHITALFLYLVLGDINAQRFEFGVKGSRCNDAIKISDSFLTSLEDSLGKISVQQTKLPGFFGAYFKFYPTNNNFFFYQDFHSVRIRHDYDHNYYESAYKKSVNEGNDAALTIFFTRKRISNLLVGYEFPKYKVTKLYVAGGVRFVYTVLKVNLHDPNNSYWLSRYRSDVLKMQNAYIDVNKNYIAFNVAAGFKVKRITGQIQVSSSPFLKSTDYLSVKNTIVEGSMCFLFGSKNIIRSQYKEKEVGAGSVVYSSKAKMIFSVYTEPSVYNRFSRYIYQDDIVFGNLNKITDSSSANSNVSTYHNGDLSIQQSKGPKIMEVLSIGLAAEAKLPKHFYIKGKFALSRMSMDHKGKQNLNGGYFENKDTLLVYNQIDNENSYMETKLRHTTMGIQIGYNTAKKFSPFAEVGLIYNWFHFTKNEVMYTVDSYSKGEGGIKTNENRSARTLISYTKMMDNMQMKTKIAGFSLSAGYKFDNILLYLNYTRTLSDFNQANLYSSIGKFSSLKIGLAYQFYKLYFK